MLISRRKRGKNGYWFENSAGKPSDSHLLFADDSLFFCKATVEEYNVIMKLLRNYEAASGQQINFSKSLIQFGHKVPDEMRHQLQNQLGITNLGGMGNYLGILNVLVDQKSKFLVF